MSGTLGIDTASGQFAVAFSPVGEGEIRISQQEAGQNHSRLLLAAIRDIIGNERRQIGAIVVVTGPGSYAGIRVGVATAQALAFAWGVSVFGVGTMEAAAAASLADDVTVIHPAGRGQFAAQPWSSGSSSGPIAIAVPESLQGLRLAGEGAGTLGGLELSPSERLRAAVALVASGSRSAGTDVTYLREPNITVSRRPMPVVTAG